MGQLSSLSIASHMPNPPTVSGRSTGLYHFFFVPIFARIFHPKDFGSFSILSKMASIFSVISSLSFFSICLGLMSASMPSLSISVMNFLRFLRFVVAVYQNPSLALKFLLCIRCLCFLFRFFLLFRELLIRASSLLGLLR